MQPPPGGGKPAVDEGGALMAVLRGKRGAWARLRRSAFDTLEVGQTTRLSRFIDTVLVTLILLNTAAFVAETVPWIEARWRAEFRSFETFSVTVFTVEYIVRLWASVEIAYLKRLPAWRARLMAARRPYMVIDLLSILPYYVAVFAPLDLRLLRILRLIRFFKLSRYSPAMDTLLRVLSNERKSLSAAGLLLVAAVLVSATGMYHIEGRVQPERFGTVPDDANHRRLWRRRAGDAGRADVGRADHGRRPMHPGATGRDHRNGLFAGGRTARLRHYLVSDVAHSAPRRTRGGRGQ
jgi:hypothetical protein